ncbi:neuromedin-U receptor 1-like [Apis mellifera]|uniref:Neuromedin-U receptor 1-like n=1 Tax=Apis mellifera TaxID=7460 RepID=A0A8U0WQZ0_APIME|nr:neuromedin-U receptor 1-like [Apis mellifera]ACI90288.1 orphan myosuppressin-like receptor [Apis mellifera]|eukprot:NP_001276370.1 neuromedin-U receptor 1-like [Apis mellifera]
MPRHVHYEDTRRLNATLLHLSHLIRHISTMNRLNTSIWNSLNITDEDIDYVNKFMDNLSISCNENCEQQIDCYCNGTVRDLAIEYKNYHGYVALMVCLFGTLANMLNIVVLTRKDMVATPINRILTGLATADMLVMLEYIPFAIYMYIVLPKRQIFPYGWAVFVLFHMHFTQLLHTISIAITLTLAVWRYIAIRFPQYNTWCTAARCKMALWSSFLAPFIACAPSYLVFGIRKQTVNENGILEIAYIVDADYSQHKDFFYQLNFWILGVVVKLLPCVILTVISCWLIKALYRAKGRKQALKSYNQCKNISVMGNGLIPKRPSKSERRADRTTKMLVAVLLLFLVTEIPQGILGLLSGVLGDCFFRNCYHNFGEVMDILALLNGAINFILYCSMSRQFRTTFGQLFKPRIMKKWQPATQQTDVQSTYV